MSADATSRAPRAVSLDAAGTVLRVAAPVAETYAEFANAHDIAVDAETISRNFKTLFPRMAPLAFGRANAVQRDSQERSWWKTLVRNCLGPAGQHRHFNRFFDALYAHYATPQAWRLYDDVLSTLDTLEHSGVRTVVVSNFDSRLIAVLEGLGVRGRYDDVIYSAAAGAAKPASAIFELACERLGRPGEEVLHVGDDRRADFEGARAAGLQARWLRRDHIVDAADASIVSSLHEVPPLLS